MSEYVFLFDLDSTITKEEILPLISRKIGKTDEMTELTERSMNGEYPFRQSFIERVEMLKDIPVDCIREIVRNIQLNNVIVDFIKENRDRCYIVTGNLDVWIEGLIYDLGMEDNCFSSKTLVKDNRLEKVISVIDKKAVINQFAKPFVAVGDGNNDVDMIKCAEIGIGFGGVRAIAPAVLDCATHVFYHEENLCGFLEMLV